MNKVFLDLEMNTVSTEHLKVCETCPYEIIQIGAVKLDENNKEIESFSEYVRPAYSVEMDKKIEKLTGIHYEQLAEADCLEAVLKRFDDWCGEDYELYSWSLTDRSQLEHEMEIKGIALSERMKSAFSKWIDYQAEFGGYFPFENPMSLKLAVDLAGFDFEGEAHDGLNDARNTANLFIMTQTTDEFRRFEEKVLGHFKQERNTLGDLFDFSLIQCS